MILKKFRSNRIKQIRYIYTLSSEGLSPALKSHNLIPDGNFELIINFGDPIFQSNNNGDWIQRPDCMLIGGFESRFSLQYAGRVNLLGIVFNPSNNSMIFKDRADLYKNTLVEGKDIMGKEVEHLADYLSTTNSNEARAEGIENFMEGYFSKAKFPRHVVQIDSSVQAIKKTCGNLDLNTLCSDMCMSVRNFRRAFSENSGFSPKSLSNIVRAKNIMHLKRQGLRTSEIAWRLGYYDSSHMINGFKQISGMSPASFVDQLNLIDETFIRQSDYSASQDFNFGHMRGRTMPKD